MMTCGMCNCEMEDCEPFCESCIEMMEASYDEEVLNEAQEGQES